MTPLDWRDARQKHWDVIVVGTGIGGATTGYALARAGKSVLFCERGLSAIRTGSTLRGTYPELSFPAPSVPTAAHRQLLARAGRCSDVFEDRSGLRQRRLIPLLGCGTGGSSALYGMAMERFFPADFEPGQHHPRDCGSTVPERWPFDFAALLPYYRAAEHLYHVSGTRDSLRGSERAQPLPSAPPLTAPGRELVSFLEQRGCHPYRLPLACEFVPNCECCQGYLCDRDCKNDSARVCLSPALSDHRASMIHECEALHLESTQDRVTGVVCRSREGEEYKLRSETVILGAGAAETPSILRRSVSIDWPRGLGNGNDLVGRNLMRHQIDLYLVFPKVEPPFDNRQKEIAFNDFYLIDGRKLGTVQSFGALPPGQILASTVEKDLRDLAGSMASRMFSAIRPLVGFGLGRLLNRGILLAAILEDLPYAGNYIFPAREAGRDDAPRYIMKYTTMSSDRSRLETFRHHLASLLKGYRYLVLKQADNNMILGHQCGTCRAGTDPATSVLDAENRVHGLTNLYVVDSSFLPSSAGTNPSLTIAANALRVAEKIVGQPLAIGVDAGESSDQS